jgi:hypothetical protein
MRGTLLGEILRCAQNDYLTATAKAKSNGERQRQMAQLKLAATGGVGRFRLR